MNVDELLNLLFKLVIIPIIPLLTIYLQKLIQSKIDEIQSKQKNETLNKYLQIAEDNLSKAVEEVSQTYVDSLKEQCGFGVEEQKKAFEMARLRFEQLANEDVKEAIMEVSNDYNAWITASIESLVKADKE